MPPPLRLSVFSSSSLSSSSSSSSASVLLRRTAPRKHIINTRRSLSSTASLAAKSPDSTPGWEGRPPDDHAVHRSGHDPQSKEAKEGMKEHEQMKEGSQAISRKDESQGNKKAKRDHPEAPEPVIGMNEERGEVS
ncbi:hypothetical protein PV08_06718 [Exophiala spinifera]|uniref:Uncharacterized protein n=1 Tax=Exophiala spinifera TaxID=91928 RepID=A0A0D1ZM86_9EURO|nr:uncharacterized protein PV08_06718 [Exophiala spinifera]KIW13937.1 hypothetical protein PV08_06718 [Exophiala spinifera]